MESADAGFALSKTARHYGTDVFETVEIIDWSTEGSRGPSSRSESVALSRRGSPQFGKRADQRGPLISKGFFMQKWGAKLPHIFVSAGKTAISTFTFDVLWRNTLFIQS